MSLVWANDGGKSQPLFSALIKVFVYILYICLQNNADYMQHKELLIKGVGTRFSQEEGGSYFQEEASWECPHPRWHG